MSALGELLSFAYKTEAELAKQKLEEKLFPLWLANYALSKLKNSEAEIMDFEAFLSATMGTAQARAEKPTQTKKRTADEILEEFMPIVAADTQRGG